VQLVDAGVIEPTFLLCVGYPNTGVLVLGDAALSGPAVSGPAAGQPGSAWLAAALRPVRHSQYYVLTLEGWRINNEDLGLDKVRCVCGCVCGRVCCVGVVLWWWRRSIAWTLIRLSVSVASWPPSAARYMPSVAGHLHQGLWRGS
jgi:hypothetical protein